MGLLALSQSQASMLNFNSTSTNVTFVDETNNALLTSDGWLVTFWWSQTGADGTFRALGLSGFLDKGDPEEWPDNDGQFFFASTSSPFSGTPFADCYIAIGVMQVPASVLSTLTFGDDAEALKATTIGDANGVKIENWWTLYGDDDNWYQGNANSGSGGSIAGAAVLNNFFGWGNGTDVKITSNPVPEPSAWLLLGAGAAFAVVMRRRKK